MEIIKKGKLPEAKPRRFEGECSHCGCKVRLTPEEYAEASPDILVGKMFKCPTEDCPAEINVNERILRS